jgi:hypothetical protein
MATRKPGQGGTQMGLPGVNWTICMCGCGTSFVENGKGRKREYLNDTHKKRAYRERTTQQKRYDDDAQEAWKGWTDDSIVAYISAAPESYTAWLGQWELYRRSRTNQFDV